MLHWTNSTICIGIHEQKLLKCQSYIKVDEKLDKDGEKGTDLSFMVVSYLVEDQGNQVTKHVIRFDVFAKWFAVFSHRILN